MPAHRDMNHHWIVNVATHNCEPPIRPVQRKTLLPASHSGERYVILAEVPRGLHVHRTSQGRFYVRVGSTKRDLTPAELARLFQQRGREYVFDEQAVLAAAVDHLNRHRLEAFFGRSPTIPWLDLLRNTRVTAPATSSTPSARPDRRRRRLRRAVHAAPDRRATARRSRTAVRSRCRRRGDRQCRRSPRLRHLRLEDPPVPVRRPPRASPEVPRARQ